MERPPILGTRGSPLAMAQARLAATALESAHGWPSDSVEIRPIATSGDVIQDRPLAEIGGKALWTRELDRALIEGEVDFCVHSMKDVESERPDAIVIAAVLPRGDPRERLIGAESVAALRDGAVVGTSSPRRRAQLLAVRRDLTIVTIRGNVQTRLRKVAEGEVDASLLAAAGLERLGLAEAGHAIAIEAMLPAPTQAVIGIECRADDERTRQLLAAIDDPATRASTIAERAFTAALGGDCSSPVAAFATVTGDRVSLAAQIFSEDGAEQVDDRCECRAGDRDAPADLARRMLAAAPASIRALFDGA